MTNLAPGSLYDPAAPTTPRIEGRSATCPIHGATREAPFTGIPHGDRLWSWMECGHYYSPLLGWRTAELRPL